MGINWIMFAKHGEQETKYILTGSMCVNLLHARYLSRKPSFPSCIESSKRKLMDLLNLTKISISLLPWGLDDVG